MKKLDATWFPTYAHLLHIVGETYDLLDPSPSILATQRAEFEASHYTISPDLVADKPPHLDTQNGPRRR